jgi:hypothetical protein
LTENSGFTVKCVQKIPKCKKRITMVKCAVERETLGRQFCEIIWILEGPSTSVLKNCK